MFRVSSRQGSPKASFEHVLWCNTCAHVLRFPAAAQQPSAPCGSEIQTRRAHFKLRYTEQYGSDLWTWQKQLV